MAGHHPKSRGGIPHGPRVIRAASGNSTMGLRKTLPFLLLLSLAVLACGLALTARYHGRANAEAVFAREAAAQLDRVEDIIHTYLLSAVDTARSLARLPVDQPVSDRAQDDALLARLAAARQALPSAESAFRALKDGRLSFYPPELRPESSHPAAQPWFADPHWETREVSLEDAYLSPVSRNLAVTIVSRITSGEGDILGAAGVNVSLAPLMDVLREVRPGNTGYMVILDRHGRVVLDPDNQSNVLLAARDADPALDLLADSPSGAGRVERDGTPYAAFSRSLPETRWKAALLLGEPELRAAADAWSGPIETACLVLFLAAGLVGSVLCLRVTAPLKAVVAQSRSIAAGAIDSLQPIPGRAAEIESLRASMAATAGRMALLIQSERERTLEAEQLRQTTAEALVKASRTDQAVAEALGEAHAALTASLAPLAALCGRMQRDLAILEEKADQGSAQILHASENRHREAAETAQELAAVSARGLETETSARHFAHEALNADQLLGDVCHSLGVASDLAHLFPATLDRLKQTTSEIGAASAAVRELADRINMLGLSISFDAAGAGEHGQAMQATSEELRGLARNAMSLAGTMDTIIDSFDGCHAAHALAAAKTAQSVAQAVDMAADARRLFGTIDAGAQGAAEQIAILATFLTGAAEAAEREERRAAAFLSLAHGSRMASASLSDILAALTALNRDLGRVSEECRERSTKA